MQRAILAGCLVLASGACNAQADWSYPVDPYFGVLHETEYPGDEFPIDVNVMPKTMTSPSPLRMGDPNANWTYWPTPSYYWWDALTGPGILHGAWRSTAMARDLRECPADFCVQTYSPNDAGGNAEFFFDHTTRNVRIRLVRFDNDEHIGGFQIGSDWRQGQSQVPADAFILEHGKESTDCGAYDYAGDETLRTCRVYQAVIPPVLNPTTVLYGRCYQGGCSVLKVSSTIDAVTYYPTGYSEASGGSQSPPAGQASSNSPPMVVTQMSDVVVTESVPVTLSMSDSFLDSDGDPLSYSATGLPGSLRIDSASGTIEGTPVASEVNRRFPVTVTATDSSGATASNSFNIDVSAKQAPQQAVAAPAPAAGGGGGLFGPFLLLALLPLARRRSRLAKT